MWWHTPKKKGTQKYSMDISSVLREPILYHQSTNVTNLAQKSYLHSKTESLICIAQKQALMTQWKHHICNPSQIHPNYQLCYKHKETVMYIASGWTLLANNIYMSRHNKAAVYIHWCILKQLEYIIPTKWYTQKPQHTTTTDPFTILWDMYVSTDKKVMQNRPDIIILNNNSQSCIFMDISIPQDNNIVQKYAKKIVNIDNWK